MTKYYWLTDNGQGSFDYPSESMIQYNKKDEEFLSEVDELFTEVVETSFETDKPNLGTSWDETLPFWIENYGKGGSFEKYLYLIAKYYGINDDRYQLKRFDWLEEGYIKTTEYVVDCEMINEPQEMFSIIIEAISEDEAEQLVHEISNNIDIIGVYQKDSKNDKQVEYVHMPSLILPKKTKKGV